MQKIPPLRLLAWELTRACNLACKHCRAEAITEPLPEELSYLEAKKILDDIVNFAQPIIILTGGEPLMRKDVLDLAAYGTERGLRMVLATNGTLLDDNWVKELKKVGIKRVSVSIDGATAKAHDDFRGVKGAFDRTMAGIEALKKGGLDFQINTTVTKTNLNQISAISDLAIKLGAVAFHIFLLVPMGRGSALKEEVITPQEYEEVLTWLVEQRDKQLIEVKATCAPQYYRILRQKAKEKNEKVTFETYGLDAVTRGCLAGMGFCFIGSTGKVQTCGYLEIECGHVRKEPLSKIWYNSEIFNKLRDKKQYKGKCGNCEYWQVCGGCRARAYAISGDYLAEEPMCLYRPKGIKRVDMDAIDRKIINELQTRFPITSQPYAQIGKKLGLSEKEVLKRVKNLKKKGYIRRIGANFNSEKLGFVSTLCAAKVPKEKIARFAQVVNRYKGVTHNYLRRSEFNIWFTFIAPTMDEIEEALEKIKKETGVYEVYNFPATKIFKIKVNFKV